LPCFDIDARHQSSGTGMMPIGMDSKGEARWRIPRFFDPNRVIRIHGSMLCKEQAELRNRRRP